MIIRRLSLLAAIVLLPSCTSTDGRDPYWYSEGKLGSTTTIKGTSMDGRFLILNDGTFWNVDWADSRAASHLQTGDAVTVSRGSGTEFPYEIRSGRGASISARLGKKLD